MSLNQWMNFTCDFYGYKYNFFFLFLFDVHSFQDVNHLDKPFVSLLISFGSHAFDEYVHVCCYYKLKTKVKPVNNSCRISSMWMLYCVQKWSRNRLKEEKKIWNSCVMPHNRQIIYKQIVKFPWKNGENSEKWLFPFLSDR